MLSALTETWHRGRRRAAAGSRWSQGERSSVPSGMAKPGTLTCSPLCPSPLGARTWALMGMNGAATSKPGWHSWTLKYAGAARGAGAGPRFGVFWKGDRSGSQAGRGRENAKVLRAATLPEEQSVPAAPLIASKAGGEKKGEACPLVTARAVSAAGRPAAGSPRETPPPASPPARVALTSVQVPAPRTSRAALCVPERGPLAGTPGALGEVFLRHFVLGSLSPRRSRLPGSSTQLQRGQSRDHTFLRAARARPAPPCPDTPMARPAPRGHAPPPLHPPLGTPVPAGLAPSARYVPQ